MPNYALADECIDEMRKVVRLSADEAVLKRGKAEASLRRPLRLRLKKKAKDEGIWCELDEGTVLNFFRHDAPVRTATSRGRKEISRNLDHFYVQVDGRQYTFKTVLGDKGAVLGVKVISDPIPCAQSPAGTTGLSAFRPFGYY